MPQHVGLFQYSQEDLRMMGWNGRLVPGIFIFLPCKLVSMAFTAWEPVTSTFSGSWDCPCCCLRVYLCFLPSSCLKHLENSEGPCICPPSDMAWPLSDRSMVLLLYICTESIKRKSPAETDLGYLFLIF